MHLWWMPYLISIGNVASFLLALRGRKIAGSVALLGGQGLFVFYASISGQPGFLFQNVLMVGAALWGILNGLRDRRKPPPVPAPVRAREFADEFPASWTDHG